MICLVPLRKEEDLEEKRSEQLEKITSALADSNIDRGVRDEIIEKLEQHEKMQEAAKHPWGHGR
jgi:signal recognition particle GTPase